MCNAGSVNHEHPAITATRLAVTESARLDPALQDHDDDLFADVHVTTATPTERYGPALEAAANAVRQVEVLRDQLIRQAIRAGMTTNAISRAARVDRRTIDRRR